MMPSARHILIVNSPSVLRTVYAFARRPSMHQGRTQAAASVIRDAFAQAWQVTSHSCLEVTPQCRAAAGLPTDAVGPCVELRGLERFGDASPDLFFSAEGLTEGFPPARVGAGRGGQHARGPRGHAMVQAELRKSRPRVPQPVLRRRDRGRPRGLAAA